MEPMLSCCENCSSIWSLGTEEWQFQQCSSYGWKPGDEIAEDYDFYDYDEED